MTRRAAGLARATLVLAALALVGCQGATRPQADPVATDDLAESQHVDAGRRLYNVHCVGCHGFNPGGRQRHRIEGKRIYLWSLIALPKEMAMSEQIQEQYVTDAEGNRIAVIVPLAIYERLLDAWEDAADLAAIEEYEAAKASGKDLDTIPFDQIVAEYDASQSRLIGD